LACKLVKRHQYHRLQILDRLVLEIEGFEPEQKRW
jgi:hypothetical protein